MSAAPRRTRKNVILARRSEITLGLVGLSAPTCSPSVRRSASVFASCSASSFRASGLATEAGLPIRPIQTHKTTGSKLEGKLSPAFEEEDESPFVGLLQVEAV
jgi:hypothetical protein